MELRGGGGVPVFLGGRKCKPERGCSKCRYHFLSMCRFPSPLFSLIFIIQFLSYDWGGGGTPPSAATPLYVMMKKENDITPHVNKCPRNMWNEISTWKTVRKKIMLNFYVLGLQKSAIFSMWCNVTFLFCAKSTKMHFGCFMHKSTENQTNVDCTFYFLQCSDSYCLQ